MKAVETTAVAETEVAAPKAPKAKKASAQKAMADAAKAAKAKAAKKAPKTKKAPAAKAEKAPAAKKEGLRKPQLRILQALANTKAVGMTRGEIAEKAPCDVAGCTEWIGSSDAEKRAANDAKHFPSLITLGFVKLGTPAEGGADYYSITAAGRKEAAKG
jgi:membrane protein involved in colicin uptake